MNISGMWYDPSHNGCGLSIIESEGVCGVTYYGHTFDGRLLWLFGTGSRGNQGNLDIDMVLADGAGFPTTVLDNRMAGRLLLRVDEDKIAAELTVLHSVLNRVDFSPPHPPGHTVTAHLRLQKLL